MVPLSGSVDNPVYSDVMLLELQAKYNLMFTGHIGIAVGYRYDSISWTFPDIKYGFEQGADSPRQGSTFGIIYKF